MDFHRPKTPQLDTGMNTAFRYRGGDCVVSISGRITIDSSPHLRVLLMERLEAADCQSVTTDFYDVTYVDMSGLAVLLEVLRAAREQKKAFRLSGLREHPRYVLEATRLLHLFEEVDRDVTQ